MATFHIESLRKKLNAHGILEALKVLPKTFRDIHDEAMYHVESDIDYSQFALRILQHLSSTFIYHPRS